MIDTSTRYIGWCPICEGHFKVRGKHLVHHGYKRPGTGFIVGDCPGVGYPPYELSTIACKIYEDLLVQRIADTEMYLITLRANRPDLELVFDDYDVVARRTRRAHLGGPPMIVMLTQDQANELAAQLQGYEKDRYSWEKKRQSVISYQAHVLSSMKRELERMQRLIAEWPGVQPLRTTEEEIQHETQTKAERERARNAVRDAKISAEVAKIQKRIDAAVRNRNSATLADIFTSPKLQQVSGYRLERDQGLALLERDAIWLAFGLMTLDGYLPPAEASRILTVMTRGPLIESPDGRRYYGPAPWPDELGGGRAKTRGYH